MSNKWISVEKDLPKEGGRYWCYVEHINDLGISHFQWNCSYNESGKTFSDRYLTDGEKVTHWQPLPAPPTELNTVDNVLSDEEINVAALENCRLHYIMAFSEELLAESTIDFKAGIEWYKAALQSSPIK